ncbi:MAG: hypothetical protein H0T46_14170 [Deltaproteobacteria bacterium]|nr:hypothetical protein [Deltaproteobacteria bacterium]
MNTRWILISALAALSWTGAGCKEMECGTGTVERDGACAPANLTVDKAQCGPFTILQGDKCVPMFPPTECDSSTTMADIDPATGVTTCIGTGGGGCSAPLACPNPATGKQTICGQIYNFELATGPMATFAAAGASGSRCSSTPAAEGPCALTIKAYDALAFGANPQTAVPLTVGELYIDDCGRYRITDITLPPGPFIGLGIDDAPNINGPAGVTNTVGVATPKTASMATRDFEAFVVPKSTSDKWTASGGPPISGGIYAQVFRAKHMGFETQAGVQTLRNGNPNTTNDYYFTPAQTTRETILPSATTTGANGTVLITNAAVSENLAYSGAGGIPAECVWETKAGASLANIVFISIFRPVNAVGQTCPL